jgi:hypothetical protein
MCNVLGMDLFHIKDKNFTIDYTRTDALETWKTEWACFWDAGFKVTRILLLLYHIFLCVSGMSSYMEVSVSSTAGTKHSSYFRGNATFDNERYRCWTGD